jgi:F-type H+-transporting ATPase subunit c
MRRHGNPDYFEEASDVSTRSILTATLALVALGFASPLHAQELGAGAANTTNTLIMWSVITAGFALAFAAAFGSLAQGRAVGQACEAIARNPSAANDIRGNLILGLVLIESLVIYVLLIALILFFVQPFGGVPGV